MTRPYLDIHRPHNQVLVDNIPVDPILPDHFYTAPADERDPQEIDDWSRRPFIVKFTWSDREKEYRAFRAQGVPPAYHEGQYSEDWWPAVGSDESFEVDLAEYRDRFYESFPEGIRYKIYCMGSAGEGDRAAVHLWGSCASLPDAIVVAHSDFDRYRNVDILRRLVWHHEHRAGFE